MTIDDDGVHLTRLRVEDADEMAAVLADPALHTHTGGRPATREELARRYAVQTRGSSPDGRHRWFTWVIRLGDGRAVGYTQATLELATRQVELAWVVGVPWQGRGLARRAVALTMAQLDGDEVSRWVAHVHPGHPASAAVARGAGLRPTDRLVDGEVEWEAPGGGSVGVNG